MPLSWNEIKSRALLFSKGWETEVSEDAEAKSFGDDFFNVFGISRRRVATFEQQVKKIDDNAAFIDLLWKGQIHIEYKSRTKAIIKLNSRASFPTPSLTDLYYPNTIPPALVKAHQTLDKAMDFCYRLQPFTNETKRIKFFFELYDKYTAGLFVAVKKEKKNK